MTFSCFTVFKVAIFHQRFGQTFGLSCASPRRNCRVFNRPWKSIACVYRLDSNHRKRKKELWSLKPTGPMKIKLDGATRSRDNQTASPIGLNSNSLAPSVQKNRKKVERVCFTFERYIEAVANTRTISKSVPDLLRFAWHMNKTHAGPALLLFRHRCPKQ